MPAQQEIRFAVVMYGGVSLCIYIHGVAQELLRLVRSTSGADVSDDAVCAIYKELSGKIRLIEQPLTKPGGRQPAGQVETRFVVDLLSGTSAGGINAVFLAKALAVRAKDLNPLRQTWVEKADINLLLNSDADRFKAKNSLLKGQWMYQLLFQAFDQIDKQPCDPAENCQQAGEIDLFVTTTDLNGIQVPIRLADKAVTERVHKGSFHFRLDNVELSGSEPAAAELKSKFPTQNQFQAAYNGMLAFAARCTSSFPIAFAPMKLTDTQDAMGTTQYKEKEPLYRQFFRWIPAETPNAAPPVPLRFAERPLADGGYLDNKPFGHVINALTYRASDLPHGRKLLYVDPFPESASDHADQPHIDFVANAQLAAMDLPRYQTIREELERVQEANKTQERLRSLKQKMQDLDPNANASADKDEAHADDPQAAVDTAPAPGAAPKVPRRSFSKIPLRELIQSRGTAYGTYHIIRVDNTTDDLARMFSMVSGTADQEDLFLAIRYLASTWRKHHYSPDGTDAMKLESEFLHDFDFSFRQRLTIYLLEYANINCAPEVRQSLIGQLARLRRCRELLSQADSSNPLAPLLLKVGLTWDVVQSILAFASEDDRKSEAERIYAQSNAGLDELAEKLAEQWKPVINRNYVECLRLFHADAGLKERYNKFTLYDDMLSLTFLEGSDVREFTKIDVYRVSPNDGIVPTKGPKLAGYAVAAFGAFLHRDWRENDILWGRLDAAQQIVTSVLPDVCDIPLRDSYIARLQRAIVEQEAALRTQSDQSLVPALAAAKEGTLKAYLTDKYETPAPPPNGQSVRQAALAADILGRMIEEDLGSKQKPATLLKTVGGAVAALVAFITPGTIQRVFWNYWVALLGTMFLLILIIGWVAGQRPLEILGLGGVVGSALLWISYQAVGGFLASRGLRSNPFLRTLQWIVLLAVILLLGIGVWKIPEAWTEFHAWVVSRWNPGL